MLNLLFNLMKLQIFFIIIVKKKKFLISLNILIFLYPSQEININQK